MTEKKKYEAPEMKVHQVQKANIIATSTLVQTNDLIDDSGEYEF